jgi:hypothetical protein
MKWWLLGVFLGLVGCGGSSCPSSAHPPCGDQTIDTEPQAMSVPVQNGNGLPAKGQLDPETGENWYTYSASAGSFESVDPEVYLHSGVPVTVCEYMDCAATCPSGTTDDVAPGGQAGCCAPAGTYAHFQIFGCTQSDVNVWIKVSVDEPVQCNSCAGYEVDYNW